jgi:hypothetical protein
MPAASRHLAADLARPDDQRDNPAKHHRIHGPVQRPNQQLGFS